MKIDRLIGILSILLQQERVTAPYLAERFEVSRRTINRDIEDLCKAGIPLVTAQGANGGISIMEGYRLNRTLLTSSDMQAILAGLRSLDSVSGTNKYQQLMDKLAVGNQDLINVDSHIVINLSSWYKESLTPKIKLIQDAIEGRHYIQFDYYAPGGEGGRLIEPYLLVFQWASWYVWGWCTKREDYRLFKLNRMLELKVAGEQFEKRDLPKYEPRVEAAYPFEISVTAVFEPEMKWRLIEEYGVDSFRIREDGKLQFQFYFHDKENLFSWLLTFGDKVELLEPEGLREEIRLLAENIGKKYKKN